MFVKEVSQEQSPIMKKRPQVNDELVDFREIANVDQGVVAGLERSIDMTAKAIVYIFSPEIDLLQNVENNLQRYDKFQKTKVILRELIKHISSGKSALEEEVQKTSEEITRMGEEIESLNSAFGQLERENQQKDEQIKGLKQKIIILAKAYEQAKLCYEDEIFDYKLQIGQCKRTVRDREPQLYAPKDSNRAALENRKVQVISTNRSSTKRSTVCEHDQGQAQGTNNELMKTQRGKSSLNHRIANDQLEYEKDVAQHKLLVLKQQINRLRTEKEDIRNRLEAQIRSLSKEIDNLSSELQAKQLKLVHKNQTINDLLGIINSS